MNFLKRGSLAIARNPKKFLALLGTVFILGTLMAGAFSIQQSIRATEERLWDRVPPVAAITPNMAHLRANNWNLSNTPTIQTFEEVAALPQVVGFDFSVDSFGGTLYSQNLVRYWNPQWENEDSASLHYTIEWILGTPTQYEQFSVRGVNNLELMDIQAGLISLSQGTTFSGETNEAIVSEEFARVNNLTIGSTLPFREVFFDTRGLDLFDFGDMLENAVYAEVGHQLTVVGIFTITGELGMGASEMSDSLFSALTAEQEILNRIYVPISLVEEMHQFQIDNRMALLGDVGDLSTNFNSIFLLSNPREMAGFVEEASELLPQGWDISFLEGDFYYLLVAMDNLLWIADLVFWFSIGAVVVTLTLLVLLFMKDRKAEIGIYLALGEKKHKVLSQILFEVVACCFLALCLSLFSGNFLGGMLSNQLIEQDVLQQMEESSTSIFDSRPPHPHLANFSLPPMTVEEMLETYQMALTLNEELTFLGLGLAVVALSTVIPITYALNLKPKQIVG
ncbi:MAG: ABC transporter permease [Turicibacter sp.]|nr:ABC transporter permease [Turicibacter sp.]